MGGGPVVVNEDQLLQDLVCGGVLIGETHEYWRMMIEVVKYCVGLFGVRRLVVVGDGGGRGRFMTVAVIEMLVKMVMVVVRRL
ncbi:hypothetical protein QVD17_30669 [Tagetes erecta]|uniref:Uncharacterized protein n=1 Tax=Tagetes erecta TaxID=13708 RepID=A0AAD8K4Q2_TARER|nr:hypothetical protein QVD17_30669 [Tagetes erecta]